MPNPDRKLYDWLLEWKKWSLVAIVAVVGFGIFFLTRHKTEFVYELFHHVGLFLAAVVVVHFIYEMMIKRYQEADLLEKEADLLEKVSQTINSTVEGLYPAFQRWGFHGFSEPLEPAEVLQRLESSDELLWLDTYAPSRFLIQPALTEALNRGAKIKMLAMLPTSTTAEYRAMEVTLPGFTADDFKNDLQNFINTMCSAANASKHPELFNLRLYDNLPGVPMYIRTRGGVPIEGLTGFYLSSPSEYFAHIAWTYSKEGMLEHFKKYFDNKWDKAKKYP